MKPYGVMRPLGPLKIGSPKLQPR